VIKAVDFEFCVGVPWDSLDVTP